jgi:hypothetical protein
LPPASAETGDATAGIIPYKNPNALLAYYIGLFSLMPGIGFFMAIIAIWLGISGLRYAKEHPVVKGKVHAWVGIICGGFWLLVYIAIALAILLSVLGR